MSNIIIGVCGGIAAYKAIELARLYIKNGHTVRVILTQHAQQFITPLTFSAITHEPVYTNLFNNNDPMVHISLAKWADKIIIAPATASIIAKIAHAMADDLLSTMLLASSAPIYLAPAMNRVMWEHFAVQKNLAWLMSHNINIIAPKHGEQACGDIGFGRMAEPQEIFTQTLNTSHTIKSLTGKNIVITAGPTHEAIDPIRFISNHSSGKMGYAMAAAAQALGANVTLISGPVALAAPQHCHVINVTTAAQMLEAALIHSKSADIIIGAAAVADYHLTTPQTQKIKKHEEQLTLTLTKNVDILQTLRARYPNTFMVGFCAETDNLLHYATEKLTRKKLNAIIANQVHTDGYPFNSDNNTLTYINTQKNHSVFENQPKTELATALMGLIARDCFPHVAPEVALST